MCLLLQGDGIAISTITCLNLMVKQGRGEHGQGIDCSLSVSLPYNTLMALNSSAQEFKGGLHIV